MRSSAFTKRLLLPPLIRQALMKPQMILRPTLPSLCLLFLFPPSERWLITTQPKPHADLPLPILLHPRVSEKGSTQGPPETLQGRLHFLNCLCNLRSSFSHSPIPSSSIAEQDVAHKSFPSAYLPPTD